mmetsp:Transcript_21834/g.43332  ORF Transcript_21834/g.43332 Transcript_21834/m.43332 type:complete len:166 (+) Transcript_21834:30-527(+)|eukprot:CAMPEP_0175094632 /NCGR_PEP_ID=MMETSP0086_2-20121207/3701_1 /TAXON_ID=136419 /ORGANISM="Unknown Unknown, Strain D1" /LENGTH=165 /DNA_ID=CAMNT_0016367777 /DNA_START=6 /DNA_END=503 /DNA_ORIENTATION=-
MHRGSARKKQEQKQSYDRPGLSQEEVEELQEAFNLFDTDQTGTIDSGELKAAMESLGYKKKNKMVYQMIESMPEGEIDFDGFLDLMTARISDTDSREDIHKVFRLFDEEESGFITLSNLQRVAKELGEGMTQQELQDMIDRADLDGDNMISPEEFFNVMTKKNFD